MSDIPAEIESYRDTYYRSQNHLRPTGQAMVRLVNDMLRPEAPAAEVADITGELQRRQAVEEDGELERLGDMISNAEALAAYRAHVLAKHVGALAGPQVRSLRTTDPRVQELLDRTDRSKRQAAGTHGSRIMSIVRNMSKRNQKQGN